MCHERITLPRRAAATSLTLAATLLTMSCSSSTDPDTGPLAASVEVSATLQLLRSIGEQTTVIAQVRDAAGATISKPVTWTSSDPGVVTVSGGGTVAATGNGEADIVARVDQAADTVRITVAQVVASLSLSGPDTLFNPGVPARYSASATDARGNPYTLVPLVWATSDPSVATVEPGLLHPVADGTTALTVGAGDLAETKDVTVITVIELVVPANLARTLQWAFEDSSANNAVFGSSAAVFIPGVGTWRGVLGWSNEREVIRPNMMFYPGSIGLKSISSAVLLSLADDGVVGLEDTVGQWLTPFTNPNIPMGVTVRQLIQNTSGIHSYTSNPSLSDSLFFDLSRAWTPRELMEKFVLAPEFAPGTSWKSSNSGYVLAAMIAEAATGITMAELLRSRVFDPMGMVEAIVAGFEDPTAPVASTWQGPPGGPLVSAEDLTTTAAHTMLWPQPVLSAEALLEFGKSLFGDFLSAPLRAELLTSVPDDGRIPGQIGGGPGIRKYNYLGRTQWGHSGTQGTGSGFLIWDEAAGIVISLLYNQSGGSHSSSHFRLVPGILRIALDAQAVAAQ